MSDYRSLTINQVLLAGGIGQEPKLIRFKDGNERLLFSLATKKWYLPKGKDKEVEYVTWHNIVITNKNIITQILRTCTKGSQIVVHGEIDTEKWQANGSEKWNYKTVIKAHRIQLNGKKPGAVISEANKPKPYNPAGDQDASGGSETPQNPFDLFDENDLPY